MASFKIIKTEDKNLTFLIKNLDLSFINAIRRVLLSDVDGYAFDEIEIKKNTTIFHNEILQHRIGLIPVVMGTQMTFECSCTNNGDEDMYVTSDKILALDDNVEYELMKDIPIAVLRKGDTLEFVAKTNCGKPEKDIKYSVISDVNFIKMKRLNKKSIVEEMKDYVYKDLYYGRKYLLEKNKIEWETTKIYCMMINTIMMEPKMVLSSALLQLRRRLVVMRDKSITKLNMRDDYNNFTIADIDYGEAGILVHMLLKREDIKIVTYTKKHFLDKFFEFKVERESHDKNQKGIEEIKEEEMDKAIKIIDDLNKANK